MKKTLHHTFYITLFIIILIVFNKHLKNTINEQGVKNFLSIEDYITRISNDTAINSLECEKFITPHYIFCQNLVGMAFINEQQIITQKGISSFSRYHNILNKDSVLYLGSEENLDVGVMPSAFPDMFVTRREDGCYELWYKDKSRVLCNINDNLQSQSPNILFLNHNKIIIRFYNCSIDEFCLRIEQLSKEDDYSQGSINDIKLVELLNKEPVNWEKVYRWSIDVIRPSPNNEKLLLLLNFYMVDDSTYYFYVVYTLETGKYLAFESSLVEYSPFLDRNGYFWVTDEYFGYEYGDFTVFRLDDFSSKTMSLKSDCWRSLDYIWDDSEQKLLRLCSHEDKYMIEKFDILKEVENGNGWQKPVMNK